MCSHLVRLARSLHTLPRDARPRDTPPPGVTTLGQLPFILDGSKASSQFQRECDDGARLIVARLRASPPARQAVLLVLRECSYSVLLTGEDGGSVSSLASCRVVSCRVVESASLVKVKRARKSTLQRRHSTTNNITLPYRHHSCHAYGSLISHSLSHTHTHRQTQRHYSNVCYLCDSVA